MKVDPEKLEQSQTLCDTHFHTSRTQGLLQFGDFEVEPVRGVVGALRPYTVISSTYDYYGLLLKILFRKYGFGMGTGFGYAHILQYTPRARFYRFSFVMFCLLASKWLPTSPETPATGPETPPTNTETPKRLRQGQNHALVISDSYAHNTSSRKLFEQSEISAQASDKLKLLRHTPPFQ